MDDTSTQRIPLSELRVGMYVQKLDASWWKHPFLRGSFLLTDPADIATMVQCGIKEVWVDPSKEEVVAVAPQPATPAAQPAGASETPAKPSTAPPESGRRAVAMNVEVAQAKRICQAAKGQVTHMFHAARLGKAIDSKTTIPLVDELDASIDRHPAALLSVARLKTHDDYTYLHSVAVSALMLSLARELGLDREQKRLAGIGGLLHDLGKAVMPLEVLDKPGKLTDAEFATMKEHPGAGAALLQAAVADPAVQDVVLHHHEKIDGTGYPDGLKGDTITLLSRMAAVCDVYDAVTSDRAYKRPWDPSLAMRQMAKWDGHFDKKIFNAFVKTVGIYPVGALVKLASQRLAVVVEPGAESLLTPKVRVFFSARSNEPVRLEIVDLAASWCRDKISGPEDPVKWGFKNLEQLWAP